MTSRALRSLARSYGVQLSYRGVDGKVKAAGTDSLLAVTRALGADIDTIEDAARALRERESQQHDAGGVVVAWDGVLPDDLASDEIVLEDGTTTSPAEAPLPFGYHRLVGPRGRSTLVIAAPASAPQPDAGSWGVFVPLYALRTERSWGIGDLTDLETLTRWTTKLGGHVVATLPLQSTYLRGPTVDASPYSPASRLFYNETYVDPHRTPEFEGSSEARALVSSEEFRKRIAALQRAKLVDHQGAYAAKREVLELLARRFVAKPRRHDLRAFLEEEPFALDHARFRAHVEREGMPGRRWPVPQETPSSPDEWYHLYAQLVSHEQLTALAASDARGGLHLDLPVGVHSSSYDTWRFGDRFARGISVGAPPDAFFRDGQNWGFPPLDPVASRANGHDYFIAAIRKLVRASSVLRIDHVMALHRLYWIPDGMNADDGVYVRYPADELYAILTLEAARCGTAIVGEDLGTVPRQVRSSMRAHGVLSTYVAQFETSDDRTAALRAPHRRSLACVNTHDTATFAAFFEELPARSRKALVGYLSDSGFLERGADDAKDVVRGVLRYLASSEASIVIANLEDLWGEPRPQNVPGTSSDEQPNWRRKTARSFERFSSDRSVTSFLAEIARLRAEVA